MEKVKAPEDDVKPENVFCASKMYFVPHFRPFSNLISSAFSPRDTDLFYSSSANSILTCSINSSGFSTCGSCFVLFISTISIDGS